MYYLYFILIPTVSYLPIYSTYVLSLLYLDTYSILPTFQQYQCLYLQKQGKGRRLTVVLKHEGLRDVGDADAVLAHVDAGRNGKYKFVIRVRVGSLQCDQMLD